MLITFDSGFDKTIPLLIDHTFLGSRRQNFCSWYTIYPGVVSERRKTKDGIGRESHPGAGGLLLCAEIRILLTSTSPKAVPPPTIGPR